MSHAQELITAIQTGIPGRLRAVIEQLSRLSDDEVKHLEGSQRLWSRKNYVNDRLPGGLDITALHLAAKAYSAHASDARLAAVFNEMVSDLLAAGALPWLEVGSKPIKETLGGREMARMSMGQTVLEVCEGKLPPALSTWIIANCDDNAGIKGFSEQKHEATIRHREAAVVAWRERRRLRLEAEEQEQDDGLAMDECAMERQYQLAMGF